MSTVGQRIREYRQKAGKSQVELAKAIGVSKQTLYKYENDIITNIPSDKIELTAKALDVSPAALMGYRHAMDDQTKKMNDKVNGHFDKMVHTKVHTNKKRPRKNRAFSMPATGIEPVLPDSPGTP